jgi:serine protease Do
MGVYPKGFCRRVSQPVATLIVLAGWIGGIWAVDGIASAAALSDDQLSAPANFSRLAEKVSPAVVNIRTVKTIKNDGPAFRQFRPDPWGPESPFKDFFERFFGEDMQREFKQPSLGSGFVISRDGYVVTNNHVIEDADQIKVKLNDDNEFEANVIGRDPNTDLALIKIDAATDLPCVTFGDSDALKVGQWVVAIGSPFGLERTVTAGIVSAKGRVIGSGPYDDFIQTDASINPGNSGGPLINMKGEVVGINTAIVASGQGIGFAIPINLVKGIVAQLKDEGEVTRGWLGVAIQDINGEMADYYGLQDHKGVFVAEVFEGDPAEQAGMRAKDIIVEINGQKIENSRQLTGMVADFGVGEKIKIKVLRDGQPMQFNIRIAKRDETRIAERREPNQPPGDERFGLRVQEMTPDIAQRFNLNETGGVVVIEVENGGTAEAAGVRIGDVIKEIDHRSIETLEDYRTALENIDDGASVSLFIWRRGVGFMVLKLQG